MSIKLNFNKVQNYEIQAKQGDFYINLINEQKISDFCNKIIDTKFLNELKIINKFKNKAGNVLKTTIKIDSKLVNFALLAVEEKFTNDDYLKLGGELYNITKNSANIIVDASILEVNKQQLIDIMVGFELASYKFDKYFVDKADKDKEELNKIFTLLLNETFEESLLEEAKIIANSVALARDLVNEPANILNTTEFKNQILNLKNMGIEVEILEKAELEKLKMHALLGVAQGSACPPYVAIMRWNGKNNTEAPVVFVGKGVVFDSGGISIKPAGSMEDMKGDMGGAAAVVGTMHCLAKRKSSVNAIAIVGLVENMVDANAQRPGDVVTSMSGQTIEVINTDAEGRLVLADILHYAKTNFSPKIMIDLATLTGAVLIALGNSKAGLFCNNDELTQNLLAASEKTGEQLWHMPLAKEYDKLIDSKVADMRNSAGRLAASSAAAHFLKRFVGDVNWAHLDIAGTAFGAPDNSYCHSWATGFGVRLLNKLIEDNYEA